MYWVGICDRSLRNCSENWLKLSRCFQLNRDFSKHPSKHVGPSNPISGTHTVSILQQNVGLTSGGPWNFPWFSLNRHDFSFRGVMYVYYSKYIVLIIASFYIIRIIVMIHNTLTWFPNSLECDRGEAKQLVGIWTMNEDVFPPWN